MSRSDPTLSYKGPSAASESDLITRVKGAQDSSALIALVNRHSGIYFDVVNRYAATYPNAVKTRDLDDDKLFNIYQFIVAYDPTRGMKLSTYIGDRTDYLCKALLRKDERNPISPGTYVASGAMQQETGEDAYATAGGARVILEDESAISQVAEVANTDLAIEDIQKAAILICPDQKFVQILRYRHLETKTLTWREIGERIGLSHEGARKCYISNLALVKEHLRDNL